MKKLLLALIVCLLPVLSWADTVTFTKGGTVNGVTEYKWVCDNTDTDGSITGGQSVPIYGFIVEAVLVPGALFTDTDWVLELRDADNYNWLFTSYLSNTTTKKVLCPLDANYCYPHLHGSRLSIYATGMAASVNSDFTFYLHVKEQ